MELSGSLSAAEERNVRKAFAEGFGVSLGNWLSRQIDLNFAVSGTKELESGEPANKLNVLLGRAASTTTETESRLFIHGGHRDSTFRPPCFIGAAMFPGEGSPCSNSSSSLPSFLPWEAFQPIPLCRVRRKDPLTPVSPVALYLMLMRCCYVLIFQVG